MTNPIHLRPVNTDFHQPDFGNTGFSNTGYSDKEIFGDVLAGDVAIRNYLEPIKKFLAESGATELFINRPCEVMMEVKGETVVMKVPALDFAALESLGQAVAVYAQQPKFGPENPILSATLPDGERIQIVVPPAVEPGAISVTIRIPGSSILSLDDYVERGAFSEYVWPHRKDASEHLDELLPDDRILVEHLLNRDLKSFIMKAVEFKKNSAVVGDTGSGKTTLMKAICQHIPLDERLVTIEDVRELTLPHRNIVHLLYSKGGHSVAKVTSSELIGSCMRMTPSRVLPAELRGSEAWDFLKLLTTGHAGAWTSLHAESCTLAFERFMFMAKENDQAGSLSRDELKQLVRLTLDIVVHITAHRVYGNDGRVTSVKRYVDEIYFDPWTKNIARFGDKKI